MKTNAHKESVLFEKIKRSNLVLTSEIIPKNVIEDIDFIRNSKEEVYLFNGGDRASFVYDRSCVNDLSFNYFQLYNESVYLCFKEVVSLLSIISGKREINTVKNKYYLTSEYEEYFRDDVLYDTGGGGAPSFSGYWILQANEDASIKINSTETEVVIGTIVVFESGVDIQLRNIEKAISFNLSTLSRIPDQYPQKWMPILL